MATVATVSRQNALNGKTLAETPLAPSPCPVRKPQPTVATSGDRRRPRTPGATPVRRPGSRRVARSDCPMRIAHTLPTPTDGQGGDDDMSRQDDRRGAADECRPGPVGPPFAEDGERVDRHQDRDRRQRVHPDLEDHPDRERRRGEEEAGDEPEQERRRATSPRSSGGRACRSSRPRPAACSGRTMSSASVERLRCRRARSRPHRATPRPSGTRSAMAGPRSGRSRTGRRCVSVPVFARSAPSDRVVRLVRELDRLDAVPFARRHGRAVEQRHGDDEDRAACDRHEQAAQPGRAGWSALGRRPRRRGRPAPAPRHRRSGAFGPPPARSRRRTRSPPA